MPCDAPVLYTCVHCRQCAEPGLEPAHWRRAVREAVVSGAGSLLAALLQHPDSRHFRHDLQPRADLATKNLTESQVTVPAIPDSIDTSHRVHDHSPEVPLKAPIVPDSCLLVADSCPDTVSSCSSSTISLPSSLPSSVVTDPPPSIFSYSSYESAPEPQPSATPRTPPQQLAPCSVLIKRMSLYSWVNEPMPAADSQH